MLNSFLNPVTKVENDLLVRVYGWGVLKATEVLPR